MNYKTSMVIHVCLYFCALTQVDVSHYHARCITDYCMTRMDVDAKLDNDLMTEEEADAELEAVKCSSFQFYSEECGSRQVVLHWRTTSMCRKYRFDIIIKIEISQSLLE